MTQLLEQAFTEVNKFPEPEQDAIASLILDELADERRWQESFARSQEPLARLAAKGREDIRAGQRDLMVLDRVACELYDTLIR